MMMVTCINFRRPLRWLALCATLLASAFAFARHADAVSPIAGMSELFNWQTLSSNGTVGAYTYDPMKDSYYIASFGNFAGLHTLTSGGGPLDPYVDLGTDAFPSDLYRFYRASDVPGGVTNTGIQGSPNPGGILVNPKPITIYVPESGPDGLPTGNTVGIAYGAGELAFVIDGGSIVNRIPGASANPSTEWRYDLTKRVYRWDLRKIGDATNQQPDFSTGTSGASPGHNPGGLFGALNQADWNDVLTVVATEQNLRDANIAAGGTAPTLSQFGNYGRQPTWSSNGEDLYLTDIGGQTGGLYKIDVTQTGVVKKLAHGTLLSEPAVVATSVHEFVPGDGAGDQVLFSASGSGAMNYVIDSDSSTSAVKTLYSAQDFQDYAGRAPSNIMSIASDSKGNVYFADGTRGIHVYDKEGRFRVVLNQAQLFEFNYSLDNDRNNAGGTLRLQTREETGETYVTYRGDNKYAAAVRVYDGGDVNRDGLVNGADKTFFMEQYNKTFHTTKPNPIGSVGTVNDYINYINADLNGDITPLSTTGALPGYATSNTGAVNNLDRLVIAQYIDLALGDFNWDGTALGPADWAIFNSHFNIAPSTFSWNSYSWFDGDVSGTTAGVPDGLVNQFDLDFLLANAAAVPEPGSLVAMSVALAVFGFAAMRRQRRRRAN